MQAVVMFLIGYFAFRTPVGVEVLNEKRQRLAEQPRCNLEALGSKLTEYVVDSKAFLDPDLSVFILADHFHVSEDDIIDAVHSTYETNFAEYIDILRIEYATTLLDEQGRLYRTDDPDDLSRLAHKCGYLDREKFENAFQKIMQISVKNYHQEQ